jgi:DNA-binding protein H-NS
MTTDLSTLSINELEVLQAKIPHELERRKIEGKKKLLEDVNQLVAKHGFTLDELLSTFQTGAAGKSPGTRKPAKIKYRHPQQAELTWTGRGRKPGWVTDWLAKGNTLEKLSV